VFALFSHYNVRNIFRIILANMFHGPCMHKGRGLMRACELCMYNVIYRKMVWQQGQWLKTSREFMTLKKKMNISLILSSKSLVLEAKFMPFNAKK
jgi:hypothetical protein